MAALKVVWLVGLTDLMLVVQWVELRVALSEATKVDRMDECSAAR